VKRCWRRSKRSTTSRPNRPLARHRCNQGAYALTKYAALALSEALEQELAGSGTAASIGLKHDRATREAGIKVRCPLLALWRAEGKIGKWYDTSGPKGRLVCARGWRGGRARNQ
jgi:hypothetical protein